MFIVLMSAGPELEFTVSGREKETPASLGVCRVRGGLEETLK